MALPAGVTKLGSFKGARGDKGDKGDRGPRGDKGDRGERGFKGEQGLTGTLGFASAESVPASDAASVQMVDVGGARGAHFKVPRGLPGVNAVPADAAVGTYLRAKDTAAGKALRGVLDTHDMMSVGSLPAQGNTLQKWGVVIAPGPAGSFDDHMVESLAPMLDPKTGRIAAVYTGYKAGSPINASLGIAWSDDGVHFGKAGVLLAGSGVPGSPDRYGATGGEVVFDADRNEYAVFYIGLTEPGYEGGRKTLCLATTPSLTDPVWTRHGTVLAPSDVTTGPSAWRAAAVWRGSVIRVDGLWYCFVNVTGANGKEQIGFATAPDVRGPWTFDDARSPLLPATDEIQILGDPVLTKIPGGWRMDYYAVGVGEPNASDWYTTTTDELFPVGWRPHSFTDTNRLTLEPTLGTYDEQFAHKPGILQYGGRTHHYYTAVDWAGRRQIALAVDPPFPVSELGMLPPPPVLDGALTGVTFQRSLAQALDRGGLAVDGGYTVLDRFARVENLHDSSADTGQLWTVLSGSFVTTGGVVRNQDANEGLAFIDGEAPWSSFGARYAPGAQVGSGKGICLLVRYVNPGTYIYVEVKPNGAIEVVFRPGDVVLLSTVGGAIAPGDFLRIDRVADDFAVTVNGRWVGGFQSLLNPDATAVGIRMYLEQNAGWRDFTVWE